MSWTQWTTSATMNTDLQRLWFEWLPHALIGSTIILIFWGLGWLFGWTFARATRHFPSPVQPAARWFRWLIKTLIILFGVIEGLDVMGMNVNSLIASIGLTGFAVTFAMKDSLSNVLSGIMILLYQPFKTGDRVIIDKHEGEILEVSMRYTKMQTEQDIILIPNSLLLTKPIILKQGKAL